MVEGIAFARDTTSVSKTTAEGFLPQQPGRRGFDEILTKRITMELQQPPDGFRAHD